MKNIIVKEYNFLENKIKVFPLGINRSVFNPNIYKNDIRKQYGWENNTVLVMSRKFEPFYCIKELWVHLVFGIG